MIRFGKIAYLNLLPFDIFLKRSSLPQIVKQSIAWHHDVPSRINARFRSRRIDAAFISSIASRRYTGTKTGIIARRAVKSVILIPNTPPSQDPASETSNALARYLGLEGRVIIGDAALRYALSGAPYLDLGQLWHDKTGLPFVFARLCYHGRASTYKKLAHRFTHTPMKIPRYILHDQARKRGIASHDILSYLALIDYRLDAHAHKGLKRFLSVTKTR